MTISIAARTRAPQLEGRLLDPTEASDYRLDAAPNTGQIRIQHIGISGEVLSYQVLDADEAYQLAHEILKGYDRLEGL